MGGVKRHPVDSTCVASIGYDAGREEAQVEFRDSPLVYGYLGVPPRMFEEFERAESKGTFVNTVIKPSYPVRKLGVGRSDRRCRLSRDMCD